MLIIRSPIISHESVSGYIKLKITVPTAKIHNNILYRLGNTYFFVCQTDNPKKNDTPKRQS